MNIDYNKIKEIIDKSQKCQRNWDLSKKIPKEDIDLLIHAATHCPSKQNVAYYNLRIITNRECIEKIHTYTLGFTKNNFNPTDVETNSQVLANLLIVFESVNLKVNLENDTVSRNLQTENLINGTLSEIDKELIARDTNIAIGIASGYVNFLANLLGYSSGFCSCYDSNSIRHILNTESDILLLLGIGFDDKNQNRLKHHLNDYIYPSTPKQDILVNFIE